MATLVLSAVGASLGGAVGGSVLGLSSAVLGRAVGATLGRVVDQRLLGGGSSTVPTGRIDRFRLNGVGEGAAVPLVFGRIRVAGQVIWASRFREEVATTGGSGKGTSSAARSSYAYSVSVALALGEGVMTRVGRIWADGVEISHDEINMRFYPGDNAQLPDPKIEAVEGAGLAPAFRGTAYVVFEDLELGRFGNRVPQFSFEVVRAAQPEAGSNDPAGKIRGVALIPGTGEYALATTPVHFSSGPGENTSANVNNARGGTDLLASLEDLREEAPACNSMSLVVSWFGSDLRCSNCIVEPKVDQKDRDGSGMPWIVSGTPRAAASLVGQVDARAAFGGTPADVAVIEAIKAIRDGGQEAMFYPFLLMDIQAGNGLFDPWSGTSGQPVMPWRGRITLSSAPGQTGSPDQQAAAEAEVAAFFGVAAAGDFSLNGDSVTYAGPPEWSYRRFILHYAHLCALAGGVDAFCIGSELRGLTQIRGAAGAFPVVDALRALAADVRSILGAGTKIGYAADWSEYFGYHPSDGSGDVLFHLDALWSDGNIDFVGIDNYMPLADWRDGDDHADAQWGSIYSTEYLQANIEGGEGYDWYYASDNARKTQNRTPISDIAYGEDWVWRYKDIRNWWANAHHNRVNGVRDSNPTSWQPGSKPIWFTEFGCAAVDKGANQPNVFLDAHSSESALPHFSTGARDDLMQSQALGAVLSYWSDVANNPVSEVYDAPMVDLDHAHVWAWDARPWPEFPGNAGLWADAGSYGRGHWLNGRLGAQLLADVVAETCERAGMPDYDIGHLFGTMRGMNVGDIQSARATLQPLMLTHGFDAFEESGKVRFRNRSGRETFELDNAQLALAKGAETSVSALRAPDAETAGRVRLSYLRADGSFETGTSEAVLPDSASVGVSVSEVPVVLSKTEAQAIVLRWLAESRVARDSLSLTLPPSMAAPGVGDVILLPEDAGGGKARIDRIEEAGARQVEATRVEAGVYAQSDLPEDDAETEAFVAPVPVFPLFLDLPLLDGSETPEAPHVAVAAVPWPGSVAVYDSAADAGYELNTLISRGAVIGITETPLAQAAPGLWDKGPGVQVRFGKGSVSGAEDAAVLNGANLVAFGSGCGGDWEVAQFAEATPISSEVVTLSRLLRGQAGTEGAIAASWPAGTFVVVLDRAATQITLPPALRLLSRHYRVGSASKPYTHSSYVHETHAFAGVGLRPYAPAHLRVVETAGGDAEISWFRRTRIDGDNWELGEVPLGETAEVYVVKVFLGATLVREVQLGTASWLYAAGLRVSDGTDAAFRVEVAQISERYGAGSFAKVEFNG